MEDNSWPWPSAMATCALSRRRISCRFPPQPERVIRGVPEKSSSKEAQDESSFPYPGKPMISNRVAQKHFIWALVGPEMQYNTRGNPRCNTGCGLQNANKCMPNLEAHMKHHIYGGSAPNTWWLETKICWGRRGLVPAPAVASSASYCAWLFQLLPHIASAVLGSHCMWLQTNICCHRRGPYQTLAAHTSRPQLRVRFCNFLEHTKLYVSCVFRNTVQISRGVFFRKIKCRQATIAITANRIVFYWNPQNTWYMVAPWGTHMSLVQRPHT